MLTITQAETVEGERGEILTGGRLCAAWRVAGETAWQEATPPFAGDVATLGRLRRRLRFDG